MELKIAQHQSGNYTVTVPVFEGPLDLLLQLIEHSELDITAVSLAMVTDQYLDYIHQMKDIEAEEISAFLVIAAKLVQIKSEALLPRPPTIEIDKDDGGLSLIQQLHIYKQFKEISSWLQDREIKGLRSYLRVAPLPKIEGRLDISDLSIDDLVNAAEEILNREPERQGLDTVIKAPKVTIREKIALITNRLSSGQIASFNEVIKNSNSRLEIVVTFLALLELIKRFHVIAYQETLFTDIRIEPLTEFNDDDDLEIEFIE